MIYLDKLTEEKVLKMLIDSGNRAIGNGSSRIVYECPFEVIEYLEKLGADFNPNADYVIKVGIGFAGFNQIDLEKTTFESYSDTYDFFADIPCCGKMVELMENVEIPPYSQCTDCWNIEEYFCEVNGFNYNWYSNEFFDNGRIDKPIFDLESIKSIAESNEYSIDYSTDYCEKAFYVKDALDNILGETADNGQIGRNCNGDAVVYDFGFEPTSNRDSYVSCSSDDVYWVEDLYLKFLVQYLENRIHSNNYTNGDVCELTDDFMAEVEI